MLTSVIPNMLMHKASSMQQLVNGLGQPLVVIKALLVHEEHLRPALHPHLTCARGTRQDHHVVDALLGGWHEFDTGRLQSDVVHRCLHLGPMLSGDSIKRG